MTKRSRALLIIAALLVAAVGLVWLKRDWFMARAYMLTLESEARVEELQIERVIEVLGIGPDQRIADIGAGTGVFTRPFARAATGNGVVYAVDVNRELLKIIARNADRLGLANIRTVAAAEDDPLIPEPVDLIFICDTLHHIQNRGSYLETLRRYLRPSGRLAIIDFDGGFPHVSASMRYERSELESWMQQAGYELLQSHQFIAGQVFVVYECASCPGPV